MRLIDGRIKEKQPSYLFNFKNKGLSTKMEQEVKISEQKEIKLRKRVNKMRIAICDKSYINLRLLKNLIYRYAEDNRIDIVADCFTSGEELFSGSTVYNLVFLGYNLYGKNGLQIASDIRLRNLPTSIVFISENTEFVFEAFKVSPYRFLVYPLNTGELRECLDGFFKKFGTDYPLLIKTREDTVCLNSNDIYYLEADNKHSFVHLSDEAISCNKTMAKVYEALPHNHFTKINRAFIVNTNHIYKYNKETVYLDNGKQLHISRNYLTKFRNSYRYFLNPKEP